MDDVILNTDLSLRLSFHLSEELDQQKKRLQQTKREPEEVHMTGKESNRMILIQNDDEVSPD